MIVKRFFDFWLALIGIILGLPLFLLVALSIKLTSPGPIFFRQVRVGKNGQNFRIFKFRTMIENADKLGKELTVAQDRRITKVGAFLRKSKIDELPQLINVLKGEMSFVGPRPEVPRYVAVYPKKIREIVLSVPPGITDLASLEYIDENNLLHLAGDPEQTYIEKILPTKLYWYQKYVQKRSFWFDLTLIVITVLKVLNLYSNHRIDKVRSEVVAAEKRNVN